MRVRSLRLDKYGAFADRTLTFGPGLTVVVGRNEAGKSTTLDALSDLLWGFSRGKHPRAFDYGPAALSVSARVELPDGTEIDLRRLKKGLLDEATREVFEPSWISPGTDGRTRWRCGFGMDHEDLRKGGAAVFEGAGDLAELIFTARSGKGVRALVTALTEEMDRLFKAHRANKKVSIRTAYTDYELLDGRAQSTMATARDVAAAREALDHARQEAKKKEADKAEATARLHRLTEHERAVPVVGELLRLRELRSSLLAGGVVLDPARLAAYEAATAEIEKAEAELERLRDEQDTASRERAALVIEDAVLADGETITRLALAAQARDGDRGRADDDDSEADRLLAEVRTELATLVGPGDDRAAVTLVADLHVPADLASQLDELAEATAALHAELTRAEQACDQAREQQDLSVGELPAFDADALRQVRDALAAVDDEGSAAARTRTAVAEAARELARRREALRRAGVHDTAADPPEAPGVDLLRRLRDDCRASTAAAERRADELTAATAAVDVVQGKLDALGGDGIPDQETLAAARADRTRLWAELVQAWAAASAVGGPPEAVQLLAVRMDAAIRTADEVADRLIRDADAAAARAHQRHELDRARARHAEATVAHAAAQGGAAHARDAWEQLWARLGLAVPTLDGADDVRSALDEAQQAHSQWLAAHHVVAGLAGQLSEQHTALAAALAAAGRPCPGADLDTLVVAARGLLDDDDHAREARSIAQKATRDVAAAERTRDRYRRDLDAAEGRWRDLLAAAGLNPATTPTGWANRHAILDRARATYTEAERLRAQAAAAREAYQQFAADTAACAARHGLTPAAEPGAEREILDQLDRRLKASRADQGKASLLDRTVADRARQVEEVSRRHAKASAVLDDMCRDVGLAGTQENPHEDPQALPAAAERGREAAALAASARQAEERIRAAVPHGDLEMLVKELADVDDATLAADLAAAHAEVAEATEAHDAALAGVGEMRAQVKRLEEAPSAGDLHARAQEKLAFVAEYAERYVVLRVQHDILRQELEAYEQRHASPMLADAGRLLETLTAGRFVALRATDRGDQRTLSVVRADETELEPYELSEGTADQVYLALRLAGIDQLQRERCAAGQVPLPVVLDDVLMAFDDQRAQAALRVMASLAERWQVVVLTHHEHLADLAASAGLASVDVSRLPDPVGLQVDRDPEQIRAAGAIPAPRRATGTGGVGTTATSEHDRGAVRAWARENGFEVGDRGRIPADVLDAYQRAQDT